MARGTKARFERWAQPNRAGALAVLMLAASSAGEVEEVRLLIDEAKSYGLTEEVLRLFEVAVQDGEAAHVA